MQLFNFSYLPSVLASINATSRNQRQSATSEWKDCIVIFFRPLRTSVITLKVHSGEFLYPGFILMFLLLSKLHFSPHRCDPPTVSLPLRPRTAQNRRHPGRDHCQLHRRVWALPPRGRVQICVPVADWQPVQPGAFHFPRVSAVLRPDQPKHLVRSTLLHLPVPWRTLGAAEVSVLLGKQTKRM